MADDDAPKGVTFSPATIKWTLGLIAAGFAVLVGYWQISDRVVSSLDARWRLEQVQAAKDKEYASEIKRVDADLKAAKEKAEADTKAARDKAEADTRQIAKKAEAGRAWVVFSVVDTKADISTKFVKICKALKLPADECAAWSDDARSTREEAAMKKRDAEATSKDK